MMKVTCKFNGGNVFARAGKNQISLFNKHVGSQEWWREISTKGADADGGGNGSASYQQQQLPTNEQLKKAVEEINKRANRFRNIY